MHAAMMGAAAQLLLKYGHIALVHNGIAIMWPYVYLLPQVVGIALQTIPSMQTQRVNAALGAGAHNDRDSARALCLIGQSPETGPNYQVHNPNLTRRSLPVHSAMNTAELAKRETLPARHQK